MERSTSTNTLERLERQQSTNTLAHSQDLTHEAEERTDQRISVKDFKILKLIGRGNIGHVYLVRQKKTRNFFAMKVLSKQEMIQKNKVSCKKTGKKKKNILRKNGC